MSAAPVAFDCGGIPAYWVPDPRETAAALIFRIGTADETLATHGIGATVCRLALSQVVDDDGAVRVDSFVDAVRTAFWAGGPAAGVRDALQTIAHRLRNLPTLHLADVQEQLLSADQQRDRPLDEQWLLGLRYGPRDYGLAGYHRFGLSNLGPEDVQHWSDQCFRAPNAVLWFTGPERPQPLELGLGDGPAFPPPAPRPIEGRVLPGRISSEGAPVALAGIVRRGPELALTIDSLTARVGAALRAGDHPGSARQILQHLDRDWAHAGVLIERPGEEADANAALALMLPVVDEIAATGVTEDERAAHRRDVLLAAEDLTAAAIADRVATAALLGEGDDSPEAIVTALDRLELAATAACARALAESAIVSVPEGTPSRIEGLTAVGPVPRSPVDGTEFRASGGGALRPRATTLVVGDRGVTLRDRRGATTILDEELVAVLRFPFGHLGLIGADETYLAIDPAVFADGATEAILALAGHVRVIDTPELRAAEHVLDLAGRAGVREHVAHAIADSVDPELRYEEVIAAEHNNQRGAIVLTDREFQFIFSWRGEPRLTALRYADIGAVSARRRRLWIQARETQYANIFELAQPVEAERLAQILERRSADDA